MLSSEVIEGLSDIDLTVSAGEIWQVLGPNGVGKTSLLRGLAGVARLGCQVRSVKVAVSLSRSRRLAKAQSQCCR